MYSGQSLHALAGEVLMSLWLCSVGRSGHAAPRHDGQCRVQAATVMAGFPGAILSSLALPALIVARLKHSRRGYNCWQSSYSTE